MLLYFGSCLFKVKEKTQDKDMPISLPITAIFALIFTVLIFALASQVVYWRKKLRVGYGSAGKEPLQQAMSAHSNAIENLPLAIILFLMLELQGVSELILIITGSVLVFARLIHAYGLSNSVYVSFGRTYGTMITWLIMVFMAVLNVFYAF